MKHRFKYTCYLIGPMEFNTNDGMSNWRDDVSDKLKHKDLLIYNPVLQECKKVDKEAIDQIEYIKGLKRSGNWEKFYNEMFSVWFGSISQNTDLIQLLTNLRMRKHIDGNYEEKIQYWGDSEAVVRSDFIIAHLPKDVPIFGTAMEITMAFLFRIPIYLILPDNTNTDANSSMLFANQISNNGELKSYYSIDDCVTAIKADFGI